MGSDDDRLERALRRIGHALADARTQTRWEAVSSLRSSVTEAFDPLGEPPPRGMRAATLRMQQDDAFRGHALWALGTVLTACHPRVAPASWVPDVPDPAMPSDEPAEIVRFVRRAGRFCFTVRSPNQLARFADKVRAHGTQPEPPTAVGVRWAAVEMVSAYATTRAELEGWSERRRSSVRLRAASVVERPDAAPSTFSACLRAMRETHLEPASATATRDAIHDLLVSGAIAMGDVVPLFHPACATDRPHREKADRADWGDDAHRVRSAHSDAEQPGGLEQRRRVLEQRLRRIGSDHLAD